MSRRLAPDLAAAWAALDAADRAAIAHLARALGCGDCWRAVPALADVVAVLAAVRLAQVDDPRVSESDRLADACEMLGLPDDSERATRPSDSLHRRLRRWRAAARAQLSTVDNCADMGVRAPDGEAA